MFKNSILTALTLLSLTSCATIMHGTYQPIGISSNPTNADVWVDSMYVGNSPLIVEMARSYHHVVTIQLDGYETYQIIVSRSLSGWVLGNIIFGGVIGLVVDAVSGGIFELTPDQVQAEMRENNCYCDQQNQSYIGVVLKPNPSWKKIGNLVPITN